MAQIASNPVPFEVLTDSTEPVRIGMELEVYAFNDPTQIIDVVPHRSDIAVLDELKNSGGGAFSVMRTDQKLIDSPTLLNWRNVVKCRLDRKVIGAFLIRDKENDYVNAEEHAGEFWKVSGPGLRDWLHDAVVHSYGGVKPDSQGSRVFSFASERGSWYKTADWLLPVNVHQYTMDPNPSNPWGTAPAEWPDVPEAYWVWGVDNSKTVPAPEGVNFFRYEFEVSGIGTKEYSVFCAADDDFDIYMDAAQIITSREKNGYAKTWRADFELGPGTHIFAARVKNNGGAAALIAALFEFGDADAGTAARLLAVTGVTADSITLRTAANQDADAAVTARAVATQARTDADAAQAAADADPGDANKAQAASVANTYATEKEAQADAAESKAARSDSLADQAELNDAAGLPGWRVNAYPDPAPGWTPGEIMLTLLNEAEARGVRFPSFLTYTFTEEVDSDGATWPRALDWEFSLGSDYSDVVDRLEELVCDVWIDPESLALNMYATRGVHRDVQSAAVQPVKFEIGRNVVKAKEEGTSDIKNALLIETADGWQSAADGLTDSIATYGRIEGLVSTGASASVSGDVARAVFAQKAEPETSDTFDIIDVADARPFFDFQVGDWVLAPTEDGTLGSRHVMSLSVTEDSKTGKPKFAIEFDTIFEEREQRMQRWLKSTSDGTLGGSLANTSSGGGGGSSSPTPTAQVVQRGPQGLQGKAGPAGLRWRGAWDPAIQYLAYDAVSYQGSSWYALTPSNNALPVTGSAEWDQLAKAGADGPQGTGLVYKGIWSSVTSYVANDIVTHNDSQWITSVDSLNDEPGVATNWDAYGGSGGGGIPARTTATYLTSSLAPNFREKGVIPLASAYRIFKVVVSRQSRVRLYDTLAHRDADETRLKTQPVDETKDTGLMLDVALQTGTLSRTLSPVVDGVNFESGTDVPITVDNLDASSGAILVTVTYVRAE